MQVRTRWNSTRRKLLSWATATSLLIGFTQLAVAAEKLLPKFEEVAAFLQADLAKQPGWKPGHIISQKQVVPALDGMAKLGWTLAEKKTLLERVPADDDFLVKELQTPVGRKFMDQIAKYPLAYDRLERMAGLPRGQQMVHDLVHDKGGYKMVEYLTMTDGGKNMGQMLGKTAKGVDFNKPTGKLYTLAALETQLRKSHQAALAQTKKLKQK